ncbi:MAG: response regulator [Ignavibacteriales bacterium]|nr:MAG: response regulator [Ignavibacteriales bacterium]
MNKNYIAIILVFTAMQIFPQTKNLLFKHISAANGLSDNFVVHIFQDKKGFIWISTQDGINRYDGYDFKHYKHIPGDLNSLSDYAVNHIFEDSKGIFWISTREGLNRFDPKTEKFIHYKMNKDDPNSLSAQRVNRCAEDKNGNIWVATRNGLNMFNQSKGIFERFNHTKANKRSISGDVITTLLSDTKGNLWIGTTSGLNQYDFKSISFRNFFSESGNMASLPSNTITALFEDSKGNIWIGTTSGLSKLVSVNTNSIEVRNYLHNPEDKFSLNNNSITAIDEDSKGKLWIGTFGGGLNIFNPSSEKFESIKHSPEDKTSLSSDLFFTLLVDNFDNVWIGNTTTGIDKYSPTSERFVRFQSEPNAESNISTNITSMLIDKNERLWIGTENTGIKVFKNKIPVEQNLLFTLDASIKNKHSLSGNSITSIFEDDEEMIWIGTAGYGLNIFNPSTKQVEIFKNEKDNPNSLSGDYIHSVYQDSEGIIWIGTGRNGLNRFDKKTKSFKRFRENLDDPTNNKFLSSREVVSIVEDHNDYLWLGTTTGGINRFDKNAETFLHFIHIHEDGKSISSNRVVCTYIDRKKRLWVGTYSGGLNLFNEKSNSFIHFMEKDGLPSNTVQSITEDENGILWIGTTNGLSRFDTESKSFKNFDVSDGLQGKEFNPKSCLRDLQTNNLYFGGTDGLNIYSPGSVSENEIKPEIVLTDLRLYDKTVVPSDDSPVKHSSAYAHEIVLSYDQNIISFSFASLDFTSPSKNQYAYKLEGFNDEWIYSGNIREVTYTNLSPGDYVFVVKGSNSDGVWNESGTSVKVIVNPPFWKTWWAYTIYLLAALSGLVFIRRYELNRIKLKNELKQQQFEANKLQEVDQIKSRFFANISHEFRTPLTIILGSLEKLRNKSAVSSNEKEYHLVKKHSSRLLQLINQLLELSKIESGNAKLEAAENDIVKFTKRISASFSSLAHQKNIQIRFNNKSVEESNQEESIPVFFDKKKLETVFYNLLSNAIKFTPADGVISILVVEKNGFAIIEVENTGIEIPADKLSKIFDRFYQVDDSGTRNYEGTGIGLSLVKEFVELHTGRIEVESKNNRTSFTIYLMKGKDHFHKDEIIEEAAEKDLTTSFEINNENKIPASDIISETDKKEAAKTIVLVVEDNDDLREMIKETIRGDYHIIEAENGVKGLQSAEEKIPDLVISDIMMPEMNGYQLCSKLKTNEKTNHIPVILLTAKASTEDKLEGLETGADDYLIKPFNEDELKIRVRNLITIRRQMREKYQTQMLVKPADVVVPSSQKVFVDKLVSIIEKNIDSEEFSVEMLCDEIGMSRTQLHRKVKAITNQSASEFIRNFRLQKAAELLKRDAGNIAEISYRVGFGSQAYFTKVFQEVYNTTPLDYKKQHTR